MQHIDPSHIRVFPARNKSIAGVFQVSYTNNLNQPEYTFNASEARGFCLSFGVVIASKSQVEEALKRGLETCRFGWIDEHLAVIPRIKALSNCGKNQTGLVTWRAAVARKFDVFCFNESDNAAQQKDTTTQLPSTCFTSSSSISSANSSLTSRTSYPRSVDQKAVPARSVSRAQGSAGAKAVLIASTCALLILTVVSLAYMKLRRSCASVDLKEQKDYMETEEWKCMKTLKETTKAPVEDERIDIDDTVS